MTEAFYRLFHRAGGMCDRYSRILAAGLLALVFFLAFAQASSKLFWHDEIYTWLPASLPNCGAVWHFYATGADTPSPLPALLVHAVRHLSASPEIASRIPFMLAFLVLCLCLFIFIRRRYPAGYALAILLAPVAFPFLFFYASEIRAYAIVLAGAGIASVCWQSLASGSKRPVLNALGLWGGLALAICAHAFAIFLIVPFALGQLGADIERKKINLWVWVSLLLFPAGLLPVIHGELLASHAYRSTFLSRPGLRMLRLTAGDFLAPIAVCGTILLFSIFILLLRIRRREAQNQPCSGLTRPEVLFAISLAVMPLYVLPGSMVLGVYRQPYVLPAFIGILICMVAAAAELSRREQALGAALLAATLLAVCLRGSKFDAHAIIHPGEIHTSMTRSYNEQPWVKIAAGFSLPIVITDPGIYIQSHFYWTPAMQQRLWYPTDFDLAAKYPASITDQINISRVGKFFPLQTMDWPRFSAENPHFLLVTGSPQDAWLDAYLADLPRSQVTISLIGPAFTAPSVYEVRLTDVATQ